MGGLRAGSPAAAPVNCAEFITPAGCDPERKGRGGVSNPVSSLSSVPSFFSSYLQSSSSRSPVHSQPKGTDSIHRSQNTTSPLHHAPRRLFIRPGPWILSSPLRLQSQRLLRLRLRLLSKPAPNSFLSGLPIRHHIRARIRRQHRSSRRRRPTGLQSD